MHSVRTDLRLLQRGLVLALACAVAALLVLPGLALAQATPGPTPGTTTTPVTSATTTSSTPVPQVGLSLSSSKAAPGTQLTANGTGFKPTEIVDVTFNGTSVGTPTADSNGSFALSFTVPSVPLGT